MPAAVTPAVRVARPLAAVAALLVLAVGGVAAPTSAVGAGSAAGSDDRVTYQPPVTGEVWRAFEPPGHRFGAGHRGVDLGADAGEVVVAAASGTVVLAGPVAGTTWVSIDHPDGVRTSYGPLTDLRVGSGERVAGGDPLGRLAPGGHGHERADRGLHFSARRHGAYLDPLGLLSTGLRPSLVGPGRAQTGTRPTGSGDGSRRPAAPPASDRLARPGPPVDPG